MVETQHSGLDVGAVLHSAAKWSLLFGAAALLLRRVKALRLSSSKLSIEGASRIVGATHAAWATYCAFRHAPGLLTFWAPRDYMLTVGDRPSTREERRVLEGSLGYFLYDFAYLLLWERDPLFLVHHAAVFTNWGTCLQHGRGEKVMFACMAYGEVTAPLLNAWWLAKRAGNSRLERPLSRAFSAVFLPVRSVLLPLYAWAYARSALAGRLDRRLGAATARLWALLLAAAAAGGVEWSRSLAKGLLKTSGRVG